MDRKERLKQVMIDEAETIRKVAERVDYNVMSQITELLCQVKKNSKKVILAGCGTAGQAAKRIAHTLSVVEIPAFFLSPADSIHGGLGAMQQGDILILLSKSGNTQEILNYIPAAQKKGLTVIGVTENENSKLGQSADIVLKLKLTGSRINGESSPLPAPWLLFPLLMPSPLRPWRKQGIQRKSFI